MDKIKEYLENQRALDGNGKTDETLFGIKMYKILKAAKIANKLYSGYYRVDGVLVFY